MEQQLSWNLILWACRRFCARSSRFFDIHFSFVEQLERVSLTLEQRSGYIVAQKNRHTRYNKRLESTDCNASMRLGCHSNHTCHTGLVGRNCNAPYVRFENWWHVHLALILMFRSYIGFFKLAQIRKIKWNSLQHENFVFGKIDWIDRCVTSQVLYVFTFRSDERSNFTGFQVKL